MSIVIGCENCQNEDLAILVVNKHMCFKCISEYSDKLRSAYAKYNGKPAIEFIIDVKSDHQENYSKLCEIATNRFGCCDFIFELDEYDSPMYRLKVDVPPTQKGKPDTRVCDLVESKNKFFADCIGIGIDKLVMRTYIDANFK